MQALIICQTGQLAQSFMGQAGNRVSMPQLPCNELPLDRRRPFLDPATFPCAGCTLTPVSFTIPRTMAS